MIKTNIFIKSLSNQKNSKNVLTLNYMTISTKRRFKFHNRRYKRLNRFKRFNQYNRYSKLIKSINF